jgi:SAM-dependent methyltransferase
VHAVLGDIDSLRRSWEALGRQDPLWAVLTDPARRGGRWDPAEFLSSGEREVAVVFARLAHIGVALSSSQRALDFGCGAGRLTQALATRFTHVDGVDIAGSMIDAAEGLNARSNVRFHHNTTADLTLFKSDTFSFVYSSIVLQHMHPSLALGYIVDFVRVLAPGGVLVFQVSERRPSAARTLRNRLSVLRGELAIGTRLRARQVRIKRPDRGWEMEMHAVPEAAVLAALATLPCEIVDAIYTNSTTDDFNGKLRYSDQAAVGGWISRQWTVMKHPAAG